MGFEAGDVGLKIDYDKDARSKRSAAVDESERFEKFWPVAPRKVKEESEAELFARLKDTADEENRAVSSTSVAVAQRQAKRKQIKAARLIKTHEKQGSTGIAATMGFRGRNNWRSGELQTG